MAGALAKAERYRLLNEPSEAESICHDILEIQPNNQQALISLILALTDQIAQDSARSPMPWRTSPTSRPITTAPTTEASFGSAGPRLATREAKDPATPSTNGSSGLWGYLRKPNPSGLRVTTTLFFAGILASVSFPGTRTLSPCWRIEPSLYCRNDCRFFRRHYIVPEPLLFVR